MSAGLDKDTQAALLLCGSFGSSGADRAKPLTRTEYNTVARWLHESSLRLSDLLRPVHELPLSSLPKVDTVRIEDLLSRRTSLAVAVERWTSQGVWVVHRGSERYPRRLRKRLSMNGSPPLLYGVGDASIVHACGVAIVGSRKADGASLRFAAKLAEVAAEQEKSVVSGAAAGVDTEAMMSSLEAGGRVVGVLPEGIIKVASRKQYRQPVIDGRLVLVSAVAPDGRWTAGNAMYRNRFIYALADAAVVAVSGLDGGTWAGATQNLKNSWVPLYVRATDPMPPGNAQLVKLGARRLTDVDIAAPGFSVGDLAGQMSIRAAGLFESVSSADSAVPTEEHESSPSATSVGQADAVESPVFEAVWPLMSDALKRGPLKPDELAARLQVNKTQLLSWLKLAEEQHRARRLTKPGRYSLIGVTQASLEYNN